MAGDANTQEATLNTGLDRLEQNATLYLEEANRVAGSLMAKNEQLQTALSQQATAQTEAISVPGADAPVAVVEVPNIDLSQEIERVNRLADMFAALAGTSNPGPVVAPIEETLSPQEAGLEPAVMPGVETDLGTAPEDAPLAPAAEGTAPATDAPATEDAGTLADAPGAPVEAPATGVDVNANAEAPVAPQGTEEAPNVDATGYPVAGYPGQQEGTTTASGTPDEGNAGANGQSDIGA